MTGTATTPGTPLWSPSLALLKQNIRPTDVAVRLGGDEFHGVLAGFRP